MRETLYELLRHNKQGLFLLDPPTGFGKTTVVLNLIKAFLNGDPAFSHIKRIFFVTNLKTNLPFKELLNGLDEEQRSQCLLARATDEYVIENLPKTNIKDAAIINSKEYKTLKIEVDNYLALRKNFDEEKDDDKKNSLGKSVKILCSKIASDTEPTFRKFIKDRYFYNKSIKEKKEFINSNTWFKLLYPICEIEEYKVIFLTTKRFILPIDTFKRLPFHIYNDDIAKDSVFFIDEFDSTKQTVLDQIVEDGLKHKTDIIKLFLDINFALQNLTLPKFLLQTTDFHKEKEISLEEGEKPWHTTQNHFDYWRSEFKKAFDLHNLKYLIKSEGFEYDRAFLFDDGNYFNVVKDSSKKFICAQVREQDDYLALIGVYNSFNKMQINILLRDIENKIDGFARSVFYIANNFKYFKNSSKKSYEVQYTTEEALYSVLDVLNLSDDEKRYLFEKIINCDYIFDKEKQDEAIRRGFNFTEIEDSNYHDIKSIIHKYSFHITPEDILIKLVNKALVVGISATANVNTCIGNYDLTYLRKKLQEKFLSIDVHSEARITEEFRSMIEETKDKYTINIDIIDDINMFSHKEQCEYFISILFQGEYKEKYEEILNRDKLSTYYFLIELKLAYIYADMKTKGYKSFIGFLNRFPKPNDKFDSGRLFEMFEYINKTAKGSQIKVEIIEANNFDYKFESVKKHLEVGEAVYVLTTYQTIGSGKNIQYAIPPTEQRSVVYSENNTYGTKDFDAIYLLTPTNLMQKLSFTSENKHADLAKYLFQQEYLYQNDYLSYYEMKHNIANGFRQTFFQDQPAFYVKNGDLYANTLRLTVQAVGRICRCRNKNKQIYIYSDKEVVERIRIACKKKQPTLMNQEFKALLNANITENKECLFESYSQQSKRTYYAIEKASKLVRSSWKNVHDWQNLREYVLQNPTADAVLPKYRDYYFEFENKYSGYSYRYGKNWSIIDIKTDIRYHDMLQVSEQACDLPAILSTCLSIEKYFKSKNYATTFKRGKYIMNPSLYRHVYLGALGEAVGREIINKELGYALQELDDLTFYEYFDYKLGNVYFDFKHWDTFRVDTDVYSKKIKNKLSRIKGAKCFIINLVKRTDVETKVSNDDTIIQIPYLIDIPNGVINYDAIEDIAKRLK